MDDSESQSERSQPAPVVVAAADLGSNSFHLVVAEVRGGQLVFVDRRKEFVRLAAGLDERKRLTPEASARALDCLDRFGERVRGLPLGTVRVVGTNTLRLARNANDLLEAAQRSLGHPVEIISGLEEARLIYLGVSRSLAGDERRLAVDIGGGSTELIIGEGSQPLDLESLYMGCVSSSLRHFPNGRVAEKRWRRAETAALVELEPVERRFRAGAGWESAVGSSGTVHSVATVVQAAGWCEEGITLEALLRLRELLIERGTTMNGGIKGLSEGRAPVFAGGVAVLLATFKALGIERMRVAGGALREGALYDLLGRLHHEDTRHAAPTSSRTRRCTASRSRSTCCWPRWSVATVASSHARSSTACPPAGARPRGASPSCSAWPWCSTGAVARNRSRSVSTSTAGICGWCCPRPGSRSPR